MCAQIWALDGQLVQVIDRAHAQEMAIGAPSATVFVQDPSAPTSPAERARLQAAKRVNYTVRDVSWNPNEPVMMSASWQGARGTYGSVVRHEWKGYGKNGLTKLEDWTERMRYEMGA